MYDLSHVSFIVAEIVSLGYFFIAKRRTDFLTISVIGAAFYFSPFLFGSVFAGLTSDTTIPSVAYWIATGYLVALTCAGIISARIKAPERSPLQLPPIAWASATLSIAGLVGALTSSRGEILTTDKVVVLQHVGYFYVLFQTAASIACIASAVERRWGAFSLACCLLAIDLLLGFRSYVVMTAISVALVLLVSQRQIRLFRLLLTYYGLVAVLFVGAMLFLHTARSVVLAKSKLQRVDTVQFMNKPDAASQLELLLIPLQLLKNSEPFVTQAILTETIRRNYQCDASNILKSLNLIPFASRILPQRPATFYDEFQPVLFPQVTYGLGGNIWAEMLCRFGYAGAAIFAIAMILVLAGLQRLLLFAPINAVAPIAFGGTIIAFYIFRNDLAYTLVLLRQTAIAYTAAIVLGFAYTRLHWQEPVDLSPTPPSA